MPKFRIRHLLLVTTFAAITFAIARLLDFESTLAGLVVFTVYAPCFCFSIAAAVAPTRRSRRQAIRYSLLVFTLGSLIAAGQFIFGSVSILTMLFVILLVWGPQLILLEICSSYRSALVGSPL